MSAGFHSNPNVPAPLVSQGQSTINNHARMQQPTAVLEQSNHRQLSSSAQIQPPVPKSTEPIDKTSIEGKFGWMTLDSANIPCLFRGGEKYVSVRMVEQKLLSKYPSTYPEELRQRAPLTSQFITAAEAKLLNEINVEHCSYDYGHQPFTERDLIVTWKDFSDFYDIVKRYFPSETQPLNWNVSLGAGGVGGGWVQVNNTVVPYIKRLAPRGKETLRLAPLTVLKYAANLLVNTSVPTVDPTEVECQKLNDMCRSAGLAFMFTRHNTPLVLLTLLPVYSGTNILIKRLPDTDPFSGAEYCPEFETNNTHDCASLPTAQGSVCAYNSSASASDLSRRLTPIASPVAPSAPRVNVPRSELPGAASVGQQLTSGTMVSVTDPGPQAKRMKSNATVHSGTKYMESSTLAIPQPTALASGSNQMAPLSFVMPPPGMVPGIQGAWRPQVNNQADMKRLAEMMNMQAAILAQTGMMTNPQTHPLQEPSNGISKKTNQNSQLTEAKSKQEMNVGNSSSDVVVENGIRIKPVDFHGKKVSCLVKEGSRQQFALVEAIGRVYFPYIDLDEFLHTVSDVLHVSMYQLNRREEQAFIKFYGLPTQMLKCTKVLNLQDLDPLMSHLKAVFGRIRQLSPTDREMEYQTRMGSQQPVAMTTQKRKLPEINNSHSTELRENCRFTAQNPVSSDLQPMNYSIKTSYREPDVTPMANVKVFVTPSVEEQVSDVPRNIKQQVTVAPQVITEANLPQMISVSPSHKKFINLLDSDGHVKQSARKRATKANSAGLAKLSKLEDAVNRLHQTKMKGGPSSNLGTPSGVEAKVMGSLTDQNVMFCTENRTIDSTPSATSGLYPEVIRQHVSSSGVRNAAEDQLFTSALDSGDRDNKLVMKNGMSASVREQTTLGELLQEDIPGTKLIERTPTNKAKTHATATTPSCLIPASVPTVASVPIVASVPTLASMPTLASVPIVVSVASVSTVTLVPAAASIPATATLSTTPTTFLPYMAFTPITIPATSVPDAEPVQVTTSVPKAASVIDTSVSNVVSAPVTTCPMTSDIRVTPTLSITRSESAQSIPASAILNTTATTATAAAPVAMATAPVAITATAAAPVAMTTAPVATSPTAAAPVAMTIAPVATTPTAAAPVAMATAPVATTPTVTAPVAMATAPVATTATAAAPVVIATAPVATTPTAAAPVAMPVPAVAAPVATTTPPVAKVTPPVVKVATPDATTATPDATTATPDATTATPDATTATPDATAVTPDATAVTPDETTVTPDATALKPDETTVTPDATAVKPDETTVTPDETTVTPDATTATPDAPVVTPDATTATVVTPDETAVTPDETAVTPGTTAVIPDATMATPDATTATPNATMATPCAKVVTLDATVVIPDATMATPDATAGTPDATTMTPDATTMTPDATAVIPDATMTTPDATAVAPDATAVTPDATAVTPDATAVTPDATAVTMGTPDATAVTPDATAVTMGTPDATTATPDATTATPDATMEIHDATTATHDATAVTSGATKVTPDVTMVKPDATTVTPDATTATPDATTATPDATMVKPDATMTTADATTATPDATTATPDATAVTPGATALTSSTTMVTADARTTAAGATMATPDATAVTPDAVTIPTESFISDIKLASSAPEMVAPKLGAAATVTAAKTTTVLRVTTSTT